jgi:hypothetical protein
MHVNIILPSVIKPATWSLPFRSSDKNSARISHAPDEEYSFQLIHDFVIVMILQIPVFFST